MAAVETQDVESIRAQEWLWHFMRGNVKAAVVVEQAGPPIRPSAVMTAVISLLAEQGLVLSAMRETEDDRANHAEG
ncbi:hypothetical protein [Mycolicibacterium sp. D5.8-2]|uniref:hypothetical protein n=1 Tax=Mycolicibacterium sp. D5.8-2 TaxID=3085903 RepID=UPI00298C1FA5|nr:hypothetical protein [Mycolicibacterium sp. D5.8-2]MDW5609261.1 hypothetical protein [Mycolicibacterium sp. D5.8-2]